MQNVATAPTTDDNSVEIGTLIERLGDELRRAAELAVDLEHEISVFAEKAELDRKDNFQSADLLVQMLTNIAGVLKEIESDEGSDRAIRLDQYISGVTLRDMADRIQGKAEDDNEFDGGDLDLF